MPDCPMKFRYVRGRLTLEAPRILDIGCGNGSPTLTRRWFPKCHYAGADIQRYRLSDADLCRNGRVLSAGRGWLWLRREIPVASYDFVILNHVVEHMREPMAVVAKLCGKLKPGGYFWIAFPSERSLHLPHAEDETLNFYDDPTHVYLPKVDEIAGVLLANGVNVLHAGRSEKGSGPRLQMW